MELILKDYSWDMDEYALRTPQGESGQLTLKDAYMAYHLLPSPPPIQPSGSTDDYIRLAQETHELRHVFFYLHENERYFMIASTVFYAAKQIRHPPIA